MKILCVGGGTLGSVMPLIAVIEAWRQRVSGLAVEWWGTADGPERKIVEHYGITFRTISAGKYRRYLSWDNFFDLAKISRGFIEAVWRFRFNRPDCLLTAGSFVAVPVAWAAFVQGIPVFAHQQDVLPSLTNRLIAPVARKITVSIDKSLADFSSNKTVLTGNPVRQEFLTPLSPAEAKKKLGLDVVKPVVLFIGGGTGAEALNNIVRQVKAELSKSWQILHLTGENKEGAAPDANYLVKPFTVNSLVYLAAAEVVVSRAGFNTLTELAALAKAAIVIPLPHSHQVNNAAYFAAHRAIIELPQAELTPARLLATLGRLRHDQAERLRFGQSLKALFLPNAAQRIVEAITTSLK